MLVVMPLITGGALHKLLRRLGVRLPTNISRLVGGFGSSRGGLGDHEDRFGNLGGDGGIQRIMKIAQMFM